MCSKEIFLSMKVNPFFSLLPHALTVSAEKIYAFPQVS